jgi:hypothetical protein
MKSILNKNKLLSANNMGTSILLKRTNEEYFKFLPVQNLKTMFSKSFQYMKGAYVV